MPYKLSEEKYKAIKSKFKDCARLIKTKELTELGIRSEDIVRFLEQGRLEKITHGCYRLVSNTDISDESLIASLYPDGVLCMYTALFYYGYSDRTPLAWDIAIDRNASKARFNLDYPFVRPYYMAKQLLCFGVSDARYPDCTMRIFDRDRLICEALRYENKLDRETLNKAIQGYIADSKRNISNLIEYARRRNMLNKVKERIEVWL